MNIAMILEMAADALGDRLAFGTRDDGLSYDALRDAARAVADRVDGSGAERLALMEPNGPLVPATLFGAAWAGRELRAAQLPAARRPARASWSPGSSPRRRRPRTGSTPRRRRTRAFPDAPEPPAVLLFTSGTSAAPKAAVLEHDQLLAYVFNTLEFGVGR